MKTHGVTGVANARWFSRRAIFGMGVLLAAFTAQPAIGQDAEPTPRERERYDERTWTIPDGLQFDLHSDGTLGYEREEMTNWCVYVPEGELEIRDVLTSVPLVRCSWTDEAKAKRLFPLLSVDTLRTLPTR